MSLEDNINEYLSQYAVVKDIKEKLDSQNEDNLPEDVWGELDISSYNLNDEIEILDKEINNE